MRRYLHVGLLPLVIGPLVGVLVAARLVETSPAILGWLFCIGLGLMGGAFVAAVFSGSAILGSGGPAKDRGRAVRSQAPWLDPGRPKDEPEDEPKE